MKKYKLKQKNINKITIIVFALMFSFGAGFLFGQTTTIQNQIISIIDIPSLFKNDKVSFELIEDVWNLIMQEYVDASIIEKEDLIFGAIRGMLNELDDPYTVFFNKKETKIFLESVSGQFQGVGIEISLRNEILTVITPLKNTPAFRAGIRAGDEIVKIDGESTQGITLQDAVSKIRGKKGTSVVLTVRRNNEDIDISITRNEIKIPSVEWEFLDNNIVYIEIIHFSDSTSDDFAILAQKILESSTDSIILDLRYNPGGFLDVSINIAGWFLEKNAIVVIEELGDGTRRKHKSPGPGSLKDFNTIILQNEGSASASEILAGALRDNNNSIIIGEQSFGKGSVQSFENLSGNTSLKLTVAKWITPNGQYINEIGIEPTIFIERTIEQIEQDKDPQKEKAIEVIIDSR